MSDLVKKSSKRNKEKVNKHPNLSTETDRLSKSSYAPNKILKPKNKSKGPEMNM